MSKTKQLPDLTATFQPQQWIDDHALPSGPVVVFGAGVALLSMSAYDLRRFDQEVRRRSGRDLDQLAVVAGVIGDHNGPFEVRMELSDYLGWLDAVGFDPSDMAHLNDQRLEEVRQRYGVKAYVSSGMELVASTKIGDWRLGEEVDDHLSDAQKRLWQVRLYRSGNALSMEFDAPDGTKRLVNMEIDEGNLKLMPHRGADVDLDAIIVVEPERVLMSHYAHGGKAVAFDAEGVHRAVENAPNPSFSDEAAPKP